MFRLLVVGLALMLGCQEVHAKGPIVGGRLGGRLGVGGLLGGGLFNHRVGLHHFNNRQFIVVPSYGGFVGNGFGYGAGLGCGAATYAPTMTYAAPACSCQSETIGYGAMGGCNTVGLGYGAGGGCGTIGLGYGGGFNTFAASPFLLRNHAFRFGGHHHHHP